MSDTTPTHGLVVEPELGITAYGSEEDMNTLVQWLQRVSPDIGPLWVVELCDGSCGSYDHLNDYRNSETFSPQLLLMP